MYTVCGVVEVQCTLLLVPLCRLAAEHLLCVVWYLGVKT